MRWLRRVVRFVFRSVWLTVAAVVGVPVVAAVTVLACLVFLPLPASLPPAKAAAVVEPTVIYARDGTPIATLRPAVADIPVTARQIPKVLKQAVVADEDRNFYREGGINPRSVVRAAVADVRSGRKVQGASTITEQYVKLAYRDTQRNVFNKVKEAVLASQLDRQAAKDGILYHYLLLVYFGDGNYGVGAAAQSYFRRPVQDLNVSQAAALAGLIPAPSARAPLQNLAAAESARELVLGKMRQQGYLTAAQYARAMAARLWLATDGRPPRGATVVYPPYAPPTRYPAFVSYVQQWLLEHFPYSEVYGGGLRVQTTLNPKLQADAASSVGTELAGTSDPLEMALVAVEPQTGYVDAMVGGREDGENGLYRPPGSTDPPGTGSVNLALGGCDFAGSRSPAPQVRAGSAVRSTCWSQPEPTGGGSGRQPGSSWKPFVLTAAMEKGISPDTVFPAPGVLPIPGCRPGSGQDCVIHNDEGQGGAPLTLRQAMAESVNTVYAQLVERVGCPATAAVAKAMGITTAFYDRAVQPFCAPYALGEVDVSPLDMASAYGVFANHGRRAAPTPVLEVVNGRGKVLLDHLRTPPPTTSVVPANVANNVTDVLQGVFGAGGTAAGEGLGRPAAGKTGTTDNFTNAWFVGYTPTLSTAVWMGDAASASVTINYKGDTQVFGGTVSAPVWHDFMTRALAGVPATPFSQPAPIQPPAPVAGLAPATTTTLPPLEPGAPSPTDVVPTGGPYQLPAPAPLAPPAPATTTTTTAPAPTTTKPASSTTSTTSASTTTTTTAPKPTGPPGRKKKKPPG